MTERRTNLDQLNTVAAALGELVNEVVFVGGSIVELLLTDKGLTEIRPTDDVDFIVEVLAYHEYQQILRKLEKKGFGYNMIEPGPICRLEVEGISVDVMPAEGDFLGFKNDWYKLAMKTAETVTLSNEIEIKVSNAPAFVCTKLEAFNDRGKGDYLMSHDIEDVVTLINGRKELLAECWAMPSEVRKYISESFSKLDSDDDFLSALSGMLPYESQNRENIVRKEISRFAKIPTDELFSGHVEVKFKGNPFEVAIISMDNFQSDCFFPSKELHNKEELSNCLNQLGIRDVALIGSNISRVYNLKKVDFEVLEQWDLIPPLKY